MAPRIRARVVAALTLALVGAGTEAAHGQASPSPAPTPLPSAPSLDALATSNAWVAVAALAVAAGLGAGILLVVHRAHVAQQSLALRHVQQGNPVLVEAGPAAGGPELAPAGPGVSGPSELAVDQVGEFSVPDTGADTTWSVEGIGLYGSAEKDTHTLLLTPHETVTGTVVLTATVGTSTLSKEVRILPRAAVPSDAGGAAPLTVRFLVRNWGLVLVSVVIVLGAVALSVAGRLDGGNFVALVAPLAALLGVTAVSGGSVAAEGGSSAGATTGGGAR